MALRIRRKPRSNIPFGIDGACTRAWLLRTVGLGAMVVRGAVSRGAVGVLGATVVLGALVTLGAVLSVLAMTARRGRITPAFVRPEMAAGRL